MVLAEQHDVGFHGGYNSLHLPDDFLDLGRGQAIDGQQGVGVNRRNDLRLGRRFGERGRG